MKRAPIGVVSFSLSPQNAPHQLELRAFNPSARPMLAVLDAQQRQIAAATVRGSAVDVSISGAARGTFTAVVLATASTSRTKTDLWVDGRLVAKDVVYSAGQIIPVGHKGTLIVASPTKRHTLVVLTARGRTVLQARSGTTTAVPLAPDTRILIGSDDVGPIRTLVNGLYPDSDGDLLDDAAERALHTCATRMSLVKGVDCSAIADTRDTDGDGLLDGWEVLGYQRNGVTLPLPQWGANPRHKDVFAEIDFRRLDKAENDAALDVRMDGAHARVMADIYADAITTDPALRTLHAQSVANPDGRPGISLHLDTGTAPESPADVTIYGDWGGHNAVDAVSAPTPADPNKYVPQTAYDAWSTQMDPARRAVFHYVLGYTSGGGQCQYGIACGFNFNSPYVSAHEFGHSFGLAHFGNPDRVEPNCKPNYPSLMSYSAPTVQFSDGRDLGVLNDHSLQEAGGLQPNSPIFGWLQMSFGYKTDATTGSVDWNRDNQFSPANKRVRANANFQPGGECESTRDNEKPTGLLSSRSPAIVDFEGHLWVFAITADNKLSYTQTPTPFQCSGVDSCPELKFLPAYVDNNVGPVSGVDAVTMWSNGRQILLLVGIRPDGTMFERWMWHGAISYIWSSNEIPASPAGGEPSLAVSSDGQRVALAYKDVNNRLHFRSRSGSGFEGERTPLANGQPIIIASQASPAIAYTFLPLPTDVTSVGSERLIGAFPYGPIQLYAPGGADNWTKLSIPYDRMPPSGGLQLTRVTGRPSLAWVTGGPRSTLPTGPLMGPSTYPRLYIIYTQEGPPPDENRPLPNPVRMDMSYVDRYGTLRIGLDTFFDNEWSFAYGLDLLQPGQTALRAAETYSIRDVVNQVYVRPHADGIVNLEYTNFDDWKVLGWGSCTVISAQQPAATRAGCAPKSW